MTRLTSWHDRVLQVNLGRGQDNRNVRIKD